MLVYYVSKDLLLVGVLISLLSTITLTMPIKGILFDKYNPNFISKISKLLANSFYLLVTLLSFFFYILPYSLILIIIFLILGLNIESLAGFILGEWIKENVNENDISAVFSLTFTLLTLVATAVMFIVGFTAEVYGLIVIQIYLVIYTILQYVRFAIISSMRLNNRKVTIDKIYFRNAVKDNKLILLTLSATIFYFISSGMSTIIVGVIGRIGNFFEIYGIYSSISYLIASFGGFISSLAFTKRVSNLFIFPLIYSGVSLLLVYLPSIFSIGVFTFASAFLGAMFSVNYYSLLNIIVSQEQYGIQTGFSKAMTSIGELIAPILFSLTLELHSFFSLEITIILFAVFSLAIALALRKY
ncbi:hypothetical protein [Saccharolobus caldissimus]|uniref:MFS transporter n=1 Tax=Saccharolobus caldissimus TaxID=1702097 RepID=A0AAQ4CVF3_9CREN|nr:hypothetical protein [Saccharolobus caldissimus]BDB99784.1 hypothetical protein SACC_28010 [Saccharolobus caldissimus]